MGLPETIDINLLIIAPIFFYGWCVNHILVILTARIRTIRVHDDVQMHSLTDDNFDTVSDDTCVPLCETISRATMNARIRVYQPKIIGQIEPVGSRSYIDLGISIAVVWPRAFDARVLDALVCFSWIRNSKVFRACNIEVRINIDIVTERRLRVAQ